MRGGDRSLEPSPLHTRIDRSGVEVSLRGIRRCQNDECRGPDARRLLWNRDHNAAINIWRNLLYRLAHGSWDLAFSVAARVVTPTSGEQLLSVTRPPDQGESSATPFVVCLLPFTPLLPIIG